VPEFTIHRTDAFREDGRVLRYYDPLPVGESPPARGSATPDPAKLDPRGPEMRYNPLLDDYTVCAGFRMFRPLLPKSDDCPLCVGGFEAPEDYSVIAFDNRFPSLVLDPAPPNPGPEPPTEVLPGVGACEVVCYTPEHTLSLSDMPADQILFLTYAWCDRYEELVGHDRIRAVMIFENRGEAVGVTLHHPHGQIYALSVVPPRILAEKRSAERAQADGRCVFCDIIAGERRSAVRALWESARFLAAIPFFARYPYEVHIYSKRHGCASMLAFDAEDKRELAGLLRFVAAKYDALFGAPMPYMMVFHQLHEECDGYHFHVEFYPVRRSAAALKYAASVETGAGLWLNDAYPERTIEDLREAGPPEPEFPAAVVSAVRQVRR